MTLIEIICILSDIRADYNCFDPDEERYYYALSRAIDIVKNSYDENECENCQEFDCTGCSFKEEYYGNL